ncbi:MAG: amidohydrolase family protein [Candidatus Pacebacteria bacterium]|nr:amidohydrolase family protein [Candidatus Paceibacterota bacterium]MDD2757422.1 amidohydrolase family protein [Candidatus Paceibacterota bacterium]MDD3283798.1 amidohydrolase family protein [Candidatus Paceibacterota bacterium]MDD3970004.1 amidohydrolase family protein [Candidatus Paceibacterota bacterium]MDD4738070.1 amidohydrolase family protein [Candidatus Paceibacterota bacterium]
MIKNNIPIVNAHAHAAMFPFKGAGEDLPLDKWLNDVIWPLEAQKVNPDFVYNQTKLAIKEMQDNNIGAFMDMYFYQDQVARACEELKMPVVLGEGLLDIKGQEFFDRDIEKTIELFEKYKNHPFIKVSVAPHSPYTVNSQNLRKAKDLAKKYNSIYQIHASETKKEVDDSILKNNLTPIEYLESLGVLDEKTVLIHCVHLSDNDISIIAKHNCSVVHCPISNLKLGSGIAPISKLLKAGVNVALGTDGSASCDNLDIKEAGRIASYLQKGINCDPTELSKEEVYKMMTINGVKALNLDY